jgi:hypothetical protein
MVADITSITNNILAGLVECILILAAYLFAAVLIKIFLDTFMFKKRFN